MAEERATEFSERILYADDTQHADRDVVRYFDFCRTNYITIKSGLNIRKSREFFAFLRNKFSRLANFNRFCVNFVFADV